MIYPPTSCFSIFIYIYVIRIQTFVDKIQKTTIRRLSKISCLFSYCYFFLSAMAGSIKAAIWFPCIMILSMVLISSGGRISREIPVVSTREFGSRLTLGDVGFDELKLEYYRRRALVEADRVAPGGPDPQHH